MVLLLLLLLLLAVVMAVTAAVTDLERGGRGLFQVIFSAFAWTDCQNTCRLPTQPRLEPDISQTRALKLYCFHRDRGRDKGQRLEAAMSYLELRGMKNAGSAQKK